GRNAIAAALGAPESLYAPVKNASLNELWRDPELMPALRAREAIPSLHVIQPGQQSFFVCALKQAAELLDSSRAANEDLNTTGIAGQIWFVFLGRQHFSRQRTYR